MKTLSNCPACEGFVPSGARACPHCATRVSKRNVGRLLRAAVTVTVGGAFAATLMACYGCPTPGCGVPADTGVTGDASSEAGTDASTPVQEGGTTGP